MREGLQRERAIVTARSRGMYADPFEPGMFMTWSPWPCRIMFTNSCPWLRINIMEGSPAYVVGKRLAIESVETVRYGSWFVETVRYSSWFCDYRMAWEPNTKTVVIYAPGFRDYKAWIAYLDHRASYISAQVVDG